MATISVTSTSGTTSANLYSSAEAQVLARRANRLGFSAKSTACYLTGGDTDRVFNQVGAELGINNANFTTASHLESDSDKNNYLFNGGNGNLYNLNFTSGTVTTQTENAFLANHGLVQNGVKMYDIMSFGNNRLDFYEYEFAGTNDGKADTWTVPIADSVWGSKINYTYQEVDANVWVGGRNTENVTNASNSAFNVIMAHSSQWLTQEDIAKINKCSSALEARVLLTNIIVARMGANNLDTEA